VSSTKTSRLLILLLGLAGLIGLTPAAEAAAPRIGIAPLAYEIPHVGEGLARVLASEVSTCGYLHVVGVDEISAALEQAGQQESLIGELPADQLAALSGLADYLVVGEVVSFTVGDRDQVMDLGKDLNDLSRLLGTGSEIAHVALNLRLLRTRDGAEVDRWLVEGYESRSGLRSGRISTGWAASVDFGTVEFSETMIGHAAYKAVAQFLVHLYDRLALRGTVLAVSGDSVVIDLDDTYGLLAGDELTIVHVKDITDSEGNVVWEDAERVGSVQVVEFQPERCLCLILDGGGRIAEGDEARPLVIRYWLPAVAAE
jgi:curli biogenesis system outer membrane secretion channel CsgG